VLNTDHIQTTHVGSLPRPADVAEGLFARERGEDFDPAAFRSCLDDAVDAIVARQRESGIDLPSDGELGKISYATYIKDRLTGFDGDSPRQPPADLADYPGYLKKLAESGGTPTYRRPRCVGPIAVKDLAPLGLRIPAAAVRSRLGLPEPKDADELIGERPAASGRGALARALAAELANDRQHLREDLDEEAASELAEWERLMDPVVDPVRRALDSAGSYDEFAAALASEELAEEIDSSRLVESLARLAFQARGAGDAQD